MPNILIEEQHRARSAVRDFQIAHARFDELLVDEHRLARLQRRADLVRLGQVTRGPKFVVNAGEVKEGEDAAVEIGVHLEMIGIGRIFSW